LRIFPVFVPVPSKMMSNVLISWFDMSRVLHLSYQMIKTWI
jgi:hypothetical protein